MLHKAEQIGPSTAIAIQRIFEGVKIREQAYNAVNAVLRLEKAYGAERLEAACAFALTRFHSPRYRQLRTILAEKLDAGAITKNEDSTESGYIRGANYYSHLVSEAGEGGDGR